MVSLLCQVLQNDCCRDSPLPFHFSDAHLHVSPQNVQLLESSEHCWFSRKVNEICFEDTKYIKDVISPATVRTQALRADTYYRMYKVQTITFFEFLNVSFELSYASFLLSLSVLGQCLSYSISNCF